MHALGMQAFPWLARNLVQTSVQGLQHLAQQALRPCKTAAGEHVHLSYQHSQVARPGARHHAARQDGIHGDGCDCDPARIAVPLCCQTARRLSICC
jgi:hypothetical protein